MTNLPTCEFTNCKYCFEGKCSDIAKHEICEYAHDNALKESGHLVEIPCKRGDVLWTNFRMQGWYLREKDAPYPVKVVFVGLNDSEEMGGGIINVSYGEGQMMQFTFSDVGKTIFKEKAAAMERQEGKNVL